MKVDIEHKQEEVKDGWFKTKAVFVCKVNVELTEEERQIIIDKQMFDLVLLNREPKASQNAAELLKRYPKSHFAMTVQTVFENNCSHDFANIARCKDYEHDVIQALKVLKSRMEESLDTGKKTIEI